MRFNNFNFILLLMVCGLFCPAGVFAANSPLSGVHDTIIAGSEAQAIDLVVSLEREAASITADDKDLYENAFRTFAEAIYEMTNGAHYLRKIRIFTDQAMWNSADIQWKIEKYGPSANTNTFRNGSGQIHVSDANFNDARKMGGDLGHEAIHYIYGLLDQYGSGEVRTRNYYHIDDLTIKGIENTSDVVFSCSTDECWETLEIYMEPYTVGSVIQFAKEVPDTNETWQANLPSGLTEDENRFEIESVKRLSQKKMYRLSIQDLQLNRPVDIQSKGENFYIRFPIDFWCSPFSIGWRSGHVYKWSSTPLYQWFNFATEFNVNPHNWSGRHNRALDGRVLSPWELLSTPSNNWQATAMSSIWPRNHFEILEQRAPNQNDIFNGISDMFYNEDFVEYNPRLLLGLSETAIDPSFVTGWQQTRRVRKLFHILPVDIPWMIVDLIDPVTGDPNATIIDQIYDVLDIEWVHNPKAEVQIVIDRSGSMGNGKIDKARLSAEIIARAFLTENNSNKVGVTYFNTAVQNSKLFSFGEKYKCIELIRDDIILNLGFLGASYPWDFDFFDPSGKTAMYDAVKYAIDGFSDDEETLKYLFLVSDGIDNASVEATLQDVIDLYNTAGISITTFAYGEDADLELLAKMAIETGGDYWENEVDDYGGMPELTTSTIAKSYGFEQGPQINLNSYSPSASIWVEKGTEQITFIASHDPEQGDVNLSIHRPDGTLATYNQVEIGGSGSGVVQYRINESLANEMEGTWTLSNDNSNSVGISTLLSVNNHQEIHLNVDVVPGYRIESPRPVFITAKLSQSYGLKNAEVNVKLVSPSGVVSTHVMVDNGENGDALANDGIYTFALIDYTETGHYRAHVQAQNIDGNAIETTIGTSYDGPEIEFEPITRSFRKNVSKGFSIFGSMADRFSPPNSPGQIIEGQLVVDDIPVIGRINNTNDEDWFMLNVTNLQKDIILKTEVSNNDLLFRVKVYSKGDISNPVVFKEFAGGTSGVLHIPAELLENGMYVMIESEGNNSYEILARSSERSVFSVGRFENSMNWNSPQGGIEISSELQSEGNSALSVFTPGWRQIVSREVNTNEIGWISDEVTLDVFIPSDPVNPWWIGTVRLDVVVPSSNKQFQFGSEFNLTKLMRGGFNTVSFPVPPELKTIIQEPHPDIQFLITLNTSTPVFLDKMQFAGNLQKNEVDIFEIECPGPGCSIETAVSLGEVNRSTRITAYGDIWLKIEEYPTDWTPSKLFLSVASEDGAPITGTMEINGSVIDLEQWYVQKEIPYSSSEPTFIRVHNYSGRTYRVNWWASN